MEENFDIKEFLIRLLKRINIFFIFIIIFSIIFILIPILGITNNISDYGSNNLNNTYITIKVNNSYNKIGDYIGSQLINTTGNTVTSNLIINETYKEFINNIGTDLSKKYNIDKNSFDFSKFNNLLSIKHISNTPIIEVSVFYADTELSNYLVDCYYNVISKNINNYIDDVSFDIKKFDNKENNITDNNSNNKMKKIIKYGILGAGLGFLIALMFILIYDVFDNKIRSKKDLKCFNIDILGNI